MTYKEKLEEILGKRVLTSSDNKLLVDCVEYHDNCPDSWFDVKFGGMCPTFEGSAREGCLIKCWNRPYQGEDYIGHYTMTRAIEFGNYIPEKGNSVKHPDHYNAHNIEVIDFIQDWELNFCLGNAVKYICRSPFKGKEIEDLRKAIQYLEFEISKREVSK